MFYALIPVTMALMVLSVTVLALPFMMEMFDLLGQFMFMAIGFLVAVVFT